MLKVSVEVEPLFFPRFRGIFNVALQLKERGIEVARDLAGADILWIQDGVLAEREARSGRLDGTPLVIYERFGTASLNGYRSRASIKRPNVLAFSKETNFRDNSWHNRPDFLGRWFYDLINIDRDRYSPTPQAIVLSDAELSKIVTVHPIYLQPRFDGLRGLQAPPPINERGLDLFFSGQVNYKHELVVAHRRKACDALFKLGGAWNVLVGMGRPLDGATFHAALQQAKIFVSPYGYGEYSWKDYEAIFCGCILIKPESDFVVSYGFDIYDHGKHYIRCKPDFADLPDIVETIMSNRAEYAEMAEQARQELFAACADQEGLANDVAAFLKRLL